MNILIMTKVNIIALVTLPPSSHFVDSLGCKEFLRFLGELIASLAWHSYTRVSSNFGSFVFNQDCISKSRKLVL
jgi:uncharacterized membrane protein